MEKKEYVRLNGNTRNANGEIEIKCSTQGNEPLQQEKTVASMVPLSSSEQEFSFFFCLYQTKKTKEQNPALKKREDRGDKKKKRRRNMLA